MVGQDLTLTYPTVSIVYPFPSPLAQVCTSGAKVGSTAEIDPVRSHMLETAPQPRNMQRVKGMSWAESVAPAAYLHIADSTAGVMGAPDTGAAWGQGRPTAAFLREAATGSARIVRAGAGHWTGKDSMGGVAPF